MSKKATSKKTAKRKVVETTTPAVEAGGDEPVTRRDLQDWLDRWTDSIGSHLPDLFGNRLPEMWGASRELGGVIKIEERVDDDGITLRGEIPGVDPSKDIEITVDDGRLTIRAERRQSETVTDETSSRSEFRYGSYRRSLDLPPGASAEDIEASYENGILDVRIPTPQPRPEAKRIQIPVS